LEQFRDGLFPEYRSLSNPAKLYSNAMKKVENLMLPILQNVRRIGQIQLIRRQIANLLQFECQLDAHILHQSLDTFNRGLMNDVKNHYRDPEKFNYPGKDDNSLLFETTSLLEACGMDDPLQKIYVTSDPLEGLPQLLFLFLISYLPKLEYDANFGTLMRLKGSYPLDGLPLAIGTASLLKQFHPSTTKLLISYLGQFVKCTVQTALQECDASSSKAVDIPSEVVNTLIFIDMLCQYCGLPRSVVYAFVPPYIFDCIKVGK
jgi:WASH complex subunit strumpellin